MRGQGTMRQRPDPHPIRDLFIADIIDYAPKDSAEMMERPFFSIKKQKRNKPIEYETPDGKLWVKVSGNAEFGIATIWDADILVWCISQIVSQRAAGKNDIDGKIKTTTYELLKGIARGTSGQDYVELLRAINRLRTTQVQTNIRSGKRRYIAFHYLGDMEGVGEGPENAEELKDLTLRVPDWLLDGIMVGNILTLDREYFLLTGGIERAIYRIARKHAGSQPDGWTVKMATLYDKVGIESPLKYFTHRMRSLCQENQLPRYSMTETTTQDGTPAIHFVDRAFEQQAAKESQAVNKSQIERENARAAWIDAQRNPKEFEDAWAAWIDRGYKAEEFASTCADRRAHMPS